MSLRQIAIIGPGLLGGSIALALKARDPGSDVRIWARRSSSVEQILSTGCATHASTRLSEIVSESAMVIFCTPIGAMPGLAAEIKPLLGPGAIITDVGSVKGSVTEALGPLFGSRFVGSHPMAGSDQAGFEAARPTLFEGAVTILTPEPDHDRAVVEEVRAFWEYLGCRTSLLSPAVHDAMIGWISHLPHLVAAALVNTVHTECGDAFQYCGNGFRDTTRIASGPAPMWAEIFEQNREAVQGSLRSFIEHLQNLERKLCDTKGIEQYLAAANAARDLLKSKPAHGALES